MMHLHSNAHVILVDIEVNAPTRVQMRIGVDDMASSLDESSGESATARADLKASATYCSIL